QQDTQYASEMDELLAALHATGLDRQQSERLARIVLDDPAARQQYRDHCQMHAMLKSEHGIVTAMSEVSQPDRGIRPLVNAVRNASLFWYAVASAMAVAIGATFYLAPAGPNVDDRLLNPQVAQAAEAGVPAATLARAVGADLLYQGQRLENATEGNVFLTGKYELRSGLIELAFDCGASVVVECPAHIEVVSADVVQVHRGRISAYVPEEASGFRVKTPMATAVDLGTAFAVDVRPDHHDEFHVFDGNVQIWPQGSSNQEPLELTTGLATRVERTRGVPAGIGLDRWRFVRRLDEPNSPYSLRILELQPALYYRMRLDGDGRTLLDDSGGGHHGTIVSEMPQKSIWAASPLGAALRLHGEIAPTYVVVPDYPKTSNNQLAVVAWVYANSRPRWASIAKNWAGGLQWGQFHFGLYDYQGGLEVHVNNGKSDEVFARDSEPFPLNSWCHVAFVADGEHLKLYRDGQLISQSPCPTIAAEPSIPQLAIGTKLNAQGRAPENVECSLWDGRIDEVALFNHALSDRDVQQLYELSQNFGPP
ncbi:MAG: LamG-like jellyroll fold domain-containing protein, partial [Bythopirellula sp.]